MSLIGMRDICWGFGDPPLLENINLQIEKGERVCLLGRNGVGKSSILKLFTGNILPDSGDIWRQQGITITRLEQDVPVTCDGTIFDVIADGFDKSSTNLEDGWITLRKIENVLSRTRLDPERNFTTLSAGMKRLTLFARALCPEPDILLLDEPTNHLDIDTTQWMEEFIIRHVKTLLFITHDRAFLKKIANRIVELDRGKLFSYDCDYENYLKRKQAAMEAEEKHNHVFDKKLSQEEVWIRQGIKARRTRDEGRVRALKAMREAHQARRKKIGNLKLQAQEAEITGKLVIEAKLISFYLEKISVFKDFSTVILRGDKIGIIGPNGIGKTTLIKILLQELSPCSGSIRHGTNLQVAYFDQLKTNIDEQKTVQENIGEGDDFILFNGQKRHVIGYLQDFLFSPERSRTPVHVLSGGEKSRLMLAKLFTRPANVIVMDEPTNDIDIETLELLEDLLLSYKGTVLVVSHDRTFLNNVVTSTIAFEGNGQVREYTGGYDDWLMQRPKLQEVSQLENKVKPKFTPNSQKVKKIGYLEIKELENLPQIIDSLELEQKGLFEAMSDPMLYKKGKDEISRIKKSLHEMEKKIEEAYLRWEELEDRKNGFR